MKKEVYLAYVSFKTYVINRKLGIIIEECLKISNLINLAILFPSHLNFQK